MSRRPEEQAREDAKPGNFDEETLGYGFGG